MSEAACDRCGWAREYAYTHGALTGLRRHLLAHEVGQPRRSREAASAASLKAAATRRAREARRWADATIATGLSPERTPAEWVAHPYALDDLLRVLGGTSIRTIAYERRLAASPYLPT